MKCEGVRRRVIKSDLAKVKRGKRSSLLAHRQREEEKAEKFWAIEAHVRLRANLLRGSK